jgi:hypothetical protein
MTTILSILITSCRRQVKPLSLIVIFGSLSLAAFGGGLPPIVVEGILIILLLAKVRADVLSAPPVNEPAHLAPIEQQEVPE